MNCPGVGNIAGNSDGIEALGLQSFGGGYRPVAVDAEQDDSRAGFGNPSRSGEPDSASSASDERYT